MKAVILRKPKTLELVEIPAPELREKNHVLIEVQACGICGSDLRKRAAMDHPSPAAGGI